MFCKYVITFKLGDREWLDSEQFGNIEPFAVTNLPVYFINCEQSGFHENFAMTKKFLITKFGCTIKILTFTIEH